METRRKNVRSFVWTCNACGQSSWVLAEVSGGVARIVDSGVDEDRTLPAGLIRCGACGEEFETELDDPKASPPA